MHLTERTITSPCEVFPMWRRAQLEVNLCARETPPSPHGLRTTGFLTPELAEAIAEWFVGEPEPLTEDVRRAYATLELETERLYEIARGILGVRVEYVRTEGDPYTSAFELCAELRDRGSMMAAICDEPHPLLSGTSVDHLRVVHDVFGHAALGLGFDLQSEFATWLQCRTLFSETARPAAFTELVGAVTALVVTGSKPGLRAKLPPDRLV